MIEIQTVELPLYVVLIAAILCVVCLIFVVDVLQTADEKIEKVESKLKEISDRNTEIMDAFEKHLKENESYTNYQDLSQSKALEEQLKVNESFAKALEEQGKVNETFAEAIKHLDETKSNKHKSKKKTEEE